MATLMEVLTGPCRTHEPFRKIAPDEEVLAVQTGRCFWLAGFEEPDPEAFDERRLQHYYEGGYYAEIRDCIDAVRANDAETRRLAR